MHPSLNELLELRDGDVDVEVAHHVRFCGRCAEELAELRATGAALRSLPPIGAVEDQWPRIRDRFVRRRRRSARIWGAAAAACVVVVIAATFMAQLMRPNEAAPDARMSVRQLTSASQELEMVLQTPSFRSQVMSPRRAAVIVDIEDRIALVDLALAEGVGNPPDELAVSLWSDRVELLDALVTARGGFPENSDFEYANYALEGSDR